MEWRVKSFYEPRVLIEVSDVLDCPFPDSLLCLTGAELGMLRNMCQYLERRATFVSEYRENDYLAPTEEEWDDLQAIVAELEDKLMGCTELTQLLEDIKAATECACAQLTAMPKEAWPSGGTLPDQPDYDDYTSPVEEGVGDPPGELPTWDDWHDYVCKAAQYIIDDTGDLMAKLELLYSTGAAITFSAFQILVIGTAVAPPVALVLAAVELLLVLGTALAVNAVEEWIGDHKLDLVCAIFTAANVDEALANIGEVVDEYWDLVMAPGFLWTILNRKLISSVFDVTVPNYDEWVGEYSPDYCDICPYGMQTQWEDDAPPCPGDWTPYGASAYCHDDYWLLYDVAAHYWLSPARGAPAGNYNIYTKWSVKSTAPPGWTIGIVYAFRSYNLIDWVEIGGRSITSGPTGEWLDTDWLGIGPCNLAQDAYIKLRVHGQSGSPYAKWYRHLGWKLVPV